MSKTASQRCVRTCVTETSENAITHSSIVDDSPAERAGLKPGDRVVAANGVNVARSSHDEVVALIGNSDGILTLQIAPPAAAGDSSSEDESAAAMPSTTTEAVVHNNRRLVAQRPRPGVDFFSDDEDRKVHRKPHKKVTSHKVYLAIKLQYQSSKMSLHSTLNINPRKKLFSSWSKLHRYIQFPVLYTYKVCYIVRLEVDVGV